MKTNLRTGYPRSVITEKGRVLNHTLITKKKMIIWDVSAAVEDQRNRQTAGKIIRPQLNYSNSDKTF